MAQFTAFPGAVTRRQEHRFAGLDAERRAGGSSSRPASLSASVSVVGLAISFGAERPVADESRFAVDVIVGIDGKSGMVERVTRRVVMRRDIEERPLPADARSQGAGP